MRRVPERIYIRKYCKVPVRYTDFYSGTYNKATMHNCSVDGMYLELDDSILPGTEIEVVQNSMFGPVVVEVKGSRMMLGRGTACKIQVE